MFTIWNKRTVPDPRCCRSIALGTNALPSLESDECWPWMSTVMTPMLQDWTKHFANYFEFDLNFSKTSSDERQKSIGSAYANRNRSICLIKQCCWDCVLKFIRFVSFTTNCTRKLCLLKQQIYQINITFKCELYQHVYFQTELNRYDFLKFKLNNERIRNEITEK